MFIFRKGVILFVFFCFFFIFHVSNKIYRKSGWQRRWQLRFPHSSLFAYCYNNEAHEAIGMTAMSGLKGEQLYELKKMLSGKDLVDIGKWGHLVHDKIKDAEKMHFNLQEGNCADIHFTCTDENGLCLLNSIKHFYYKLLETSNFKVDKELSELRWKYPRDIVFTDTDRLKYLVSLLSDMHQPLRLGFLKDLGGKQISVVYFDVNDERKKTTLFDYLESEIIDKMVVKHSNSWYGGWTHVSKIFSDHKKDEALFNELGIDVIDLWAQEIVSDFCTEFYLNRYLAEYRDNKEEGFFIDLEKDVHIVYELEYQLERFIRGSILRAGSRIAIILNHIFMKKKFISLRKRSEFDKVSEEALNQPKATQIYQSNALFINLSILFILLLIVFYVNMLINGRNKNQLPTKMECELQEKCN